MPDAASLLSLPPEIVIEITKHLVQYDWPDDPNAEHVVSTGSSVEFNMDMDDLRHRVPWVNITQSAIKNVCNLRLACKTFRDASWKVLGTVIGERYFRLTENGLKALRDMSAIKDLVPYISTLKFARAEVHEYLCRESRSTRHSHTSHGVNTKLFRGAAAAGKAWKDHKPSQVDAIESELETVFKAFSMLKYVRFDSPHGQDGEFLGVWLTPSSKPCYAMKLNRAHGYTEYKEEDEIGVRYELGEEIVVGVVLGVLRKVKVMLQDVQFANSLYYGSLLEWQLLPWTLRTLRVSIDYTAFPQEYWKPEKVSLPQALANMTNLEDIALSFDRVKLKPLAIYDFSSERYSRELFQALKSTANLRRIVLEGHWTFTQEGLLEFIGQHASTLKCFILYGPVLNGTWLQTLRDMSDLTRDSLEYLSVKFAFVLLSNGRVGFDDFDNYTESEWPHFVCATDFGPWFHLYPNLSDEEEGDGEMGVVEDEQEHEDMGEVVADEFMSEDGFESDDSLDTDLETAPA